MLDQKIRRDSAKKEKVLSKTTNSVKRDDKKKKYKEEKEKEKEREKEKEKDRKRKKEKKLREE